MNSLLIIAIASIALSALAIIASIYSYITYKNSLGGDKVDLRLKIAKQIEIDIESRLQRLTDRVTEVESENNMLKNRIDTLEIQLKEMSNRAQSAEADKRAMRTALLTLHKQLLINDILPAIDISSFGPD